MNERQHNSVHSQAVVSAASTVIALSWVFSWRVSSNSKVSTVGSMQYAEGLVVLIRPLCSCSFIVACYPCISVVLCTRSIAAESCCQPSCMYLLQLAYVLVYFTWLIVVFVWMIAMADGTSIQCG